MPKAQHPEAASFVRQNLFAGVTSFTELEARIAGLPDEHSRGAAFEVFAEAYLATQRIVPRLHRIVAAAALKGRARLHSVWQTLGVIETT